jgi:RNA polymerase sigma-70 factor (ECF subfamily)
MAKSHEDPSSADKRLDEIVTQWSLLRRSHEPTQGAEPARKALVLRYNHAIRSYVGALMRDDNSADEVSQDVLVRLMQGGFASADAERGRFRDLLKVSVRNMVNTYWQKQNRRRGSGADVKQLADELATSTGNDQVWDDAWRKSVLGMAWRALEDFQRDNPGSIAHTVLACRAEHPDDDSPQLADRVSRLVGRPINAAAVRQQLRRARLRFAQLLVDELARGLPDASPQKIEDELAELGLWEYVREFLPDDWRKTGQLRDDND